MNRKDSLERGVGCESWCIFMVTKNNFIEFDANILNGMDFISRGWVEGLDQGVANPHVS